MSRKRDIREISEVARALGYTFDGLTRKGHLRWRNARGVLVITGSALSTASGFTAARASLRQKAQADRQEARPQ